MELPDYWKARKAFLHFPDQKPVILHYPCEHELMYEALHVKECIRKKLTESPVMTETMTVKAIQVLNAIRQDWFS